MNVSIITPSYAPDFERCRLLCESIDSFVSQYHKHLIIVDHKDYTQFKSLASGKTDIIIKEDFLPSWLHKIPLSKKWWFSLKTMPVRGWILQQIIKLSVADISNDEYYLFADSDVAFIRPFNVDSIFQGEQVRLYSAPRKSLDFFDRRKQGWHDRAAHLFGVTDLRCLTQDYISQLVVWRRDTLLKMLDFIQESQQKTWQEVLCGYLDFSEYTLYGVFAERVLKAQSGHFLSKEELCYCSWHHPIKSADELHQFLDNIPESFKSVLIQSNLDISAKTYLEQIHSIQNKNKN